MTDVDSSSDDDISLPEDDLSTEPSALDDDDVPNTQFKLITETVLGIGSTQQVLDCIRSCAKNDVKYAKLFAQNCKTIAGVFARYQDYEKNMTSIQNEYRLQLEKRDGFFVSDAERHAYFLKQEDLPKRGADKKFASAEDQQIMELRHTVQQRISAAWKRLRIGIAKQMEAAGKGMSEEERQEREEAENAKKTKRKAAKDAKEAGKKAKVVEENPPPPPPPVEEQPVAIDVPAPEVVENTPVAEEEPAAEVVDENPPMVVGEPVEDESEDIKCLAHLGFSRNIAAGSVSRVIGGRKVRIIIEFED